MRCRRPSRTGLSRGTAERVYWRLMRELAFEEEKAEIGLVRPRKKRWKGIGKLARDMRETKGR